MTPPTITLTTTVSPAGWLLVAAVALALFLLVLVLILWSTKRRSATHRSSEAPKLAADVELAAQPLMTESEAAFYNVLRLAVQDEYLVLAQVPLWCLVEVNGRSPESRRSWLDDMALKRVDFVLVHPGNLTAIKVIELEPDAEPRAARRRRNAFVDGVLSAAGVEVLRLPANDSYTIPSVASLLDIEQPE